MIDETVGKGLPQENHIPAFQEPENRTSLCSQQILTVKS